MSNSQPNLPEEKIEEQVIEEPQLASTDPEDPSVLPIVFFELIKLCGVLVGIYIAILLLKPLWYPVLDAILE